MLVGALWIHYWVSCDSILIATGIVALCAIALLLHRVRRSSARMIAWCALGAVLGLVLSCVYMNAYTHQVSYFDDRKTHTWELALTGDARQSSYSTIVSAMILSVDGNPIRTLPCFRTVTLFVNQRDISFEDKLLYGDRLIVTGSFEESDEAYLVTNRESGILGSLSARDVKIDSNPSLFKGIHVLRRNVLQSIEECSYNEQTTAVVEAIVCGYKVPLSKLDIYETYKTCGIAHMVAVSGAHLSIVCGLLCGFLAYLNVRKRTALLIQIAFIVLYMCFTGMQISTLRAALMMACALSSFLFGKRPASLSALGFCIIVLCSLDPTTCLSLSFFLSAGSTLGIIMFSHLIEHWLVTWFGCKRKATENLCSLAALTLSANLVTLPVCASVFSQISCISLVVNIVVAPLFTVLCSLGVICCVICNIAPFIFSMVLHVVFLSGDALNIVCCWFASVPGAALPANVTMETALAVTLITVCSLYLLWPEIRLLPICVVAVCLFAYALVLSLLVPSSRIVMVDVGQGDAILVMSEGRTALIDTGCDDAKLKQALARYHVQTIDLLFLTHPDNDHIGSYSVLDALVQIRNVCVARGVSDCPCVKCSDLRKIMYATNEASVRYLSCQDTFHMGCVSFCVLGPGAFADQGGNADSLCLQIDADYNDDGNSDYSALFCGDAEAETLEKMFAGKTSITYDILKISHHGSKAALSETLAEKIRASIALVSVGENSYGHPNASTIALAKTMGAHVYHTDKQGDVIIDISKPVLTVTTLK